MRRLITVLALALLSAPASAQLDNVGIALVPDLRLGDGAAALPARRRHPPQLRLEAGDRGVQAGAEDPA